MKVAKIHNALKFRQSLWMKDYIEEYIHKRKIAKANGDKFGIMYYKLKNNAVFGKQMENIQKHMIIELLRTEEDKKIRFLANLLLFVGFKAFEGEIIAIHMLKNTVTLNKPIYVGQAILDISKAMMFNFWYSYIKPRYRDKARLLYTDTDSLIMWIETEDIYKDQAKRPDFFDFNYSGDLFLIKDEIKGNPIGESVCLKPKMYSVLPAGHDPKTLETDVDFEKELEEKEFRKSQGVKYWKKKHGIQKAKDNDLCASLEELYELYYHIAKEENRERSDDEIEQILRAPITKYEINSNLHNMESLEDIIEDVNKNIKKVFLAEVVPEF
ncbi:hypothetical protein RclHR1_17610001 [Rhizophagus clarus]|uniref:DNA-directed DNA polymerase n=1 Tax=Rhizophagus clarus TaxID=94130 RepID=A0A2Z6QPF1_9GLOM|nr:hypothetical protein RclHR1_17610001 [Rhizophagus clarus]